MLQTKGLINKFFVKQGVKRQRQEWEVTQTRLEKNWQRFVTWLGGDGIFKKAMKMQETSYEAMLVNLLHTKDKNETAEFKKSWVKSMDV